MCMKQKIYDHSPIMLQNIFISLQGAIHNTRRINWKTCKKHYHELIESQWWPRDEHDQAQFNSLKNHLTYAGTFIPYYKKLFQELSFNPLELQNTDDIRRIPALKKDQIRTFPLEFIHCGKIDRKWNRFFTSGTTGTPLNLWSSKESFGRIWSFVYRLRKWGNLQDPFFPRRVQFTGRDIASNDISTQTGIYWRFNKPGNTLLMSTSHLNQGTIPGYIEAIRAFAPELIDGYPSALAIISKYALNHRIKLPSPRAIITSAETLLDTDKISIQTAFQCRIFNQYASSDTAAFISFL